MSSNIEETVQGGNSENGLEAPADLTESGAGQSSVNEEEDDFAFQLRQEAEERARSGNGSSASAVQSDQNASGAETGVVATAAGTYIYTDPNDGTVYEYDYERKAWIPKVDDDFIARYQAQYGVYDPEQQATLAQQTLGNNASSSSTQQVSNPPVEKPRERPPEDLDDEGKKAWLKDRKKEKRKLAMERQKQQASWFEIDETHNTNVYVSGLPSDIELQEFEEIMSKCGILAKDVETKKPKLKLYRDSEGNAKGDGLCGYLKRESVELALQILDGYDVRGNKLKVEMAHFQQKGEYDPSKKKKKLSAKQKLKLKEQQEKLFDWRPERLRGQRPKSDCTVIIKRLFTLEELATNYLHLKDALKAQCEKYGDVKKIVIYDNNPEGVASVTFKDAESADDCIKMMDWRHFEGKQLRAEQWDGKTKYKLEETEEERTKRMAGWQQYLDAGGDTSKNS